MPRRLARLGSRLPLLLFTVAAGFPLRADEGLQHFVDRLMRATQGSVIVSEPCSGRVLAVWNQQVAFRQAFPPGSTAKLIVSAAVLEEGVITPSQSIICRRVPRLLGDSFHCSHPRADEPYCMAAAIANSCNYFFSEVSSRLTTSALAHWYAAFGFGAPGEVRIRDTPRSRALAALGAEGVRVTPAHLLMAYSALATGGKVWALVVTGEQQAPWVARVVPLKKTTLEVLSQGLRECVDNGTCRSAAVTDVSLAGKTGTAAALDGSRTTHGWFVGYAPSDEPEVAVVVFLNRGSGGDAAPLAAQILHHYFAQKRGAP